MLGIVFGVKHFHQYLFWVHNYVRPLSPQVSPQWAARNSNIGLCTFTEMGNDLKRLQLHDRLQTGFPVMLMQMDWVVCRCWGSRWRYPYRKSWFVCWRSLQMMTLTTKQIRQGTDRDPLLSRVRENILQGWKDTDRAGMRPFIKKINWACRMAVFCGEAAWWCHLQNGTR